MSGVVAYGLREAFEGTVDVDGEQVPKYAGGLIRVGDGELNVREALDEGDGVIVVDETDEPAKVALDGYPPLKRVAVPEGAEPVVGGYADRSNNELRAELNRRGIAGGGRSSHDELVEALEGHDELGEAGRLPAEVTVKSIAEARAEASNGEEG